MLGAPCLKKKTPRIDDLEATVPPITKEKYKELRTNKNEASSGLINPIYTTIMGKRF